MLSLVLEIDVNDLQITEKKLLKDIKYNNTRRIV